MKRIKPLLLMDKSQFPMVKLTNAVPGSVNIIVTAAKANGMAIMDRLSVNPNPIFDRMFITRRNNQDNPNATQVPSGSSTFDKIYKRVIISFTLESSLWIRLVFV